MGLFIFCPKGIQLRFIYIKLIDNRIELRSEFIQLK